MKLFIKFYESFGIDYYQIFANKYKYTCYKLFSSEIKESKYSEWN